MQELNSTKYIRPGFPISQQPTTRPPDGVDSRSFLPVFAHWNDFLMNSWDYCTTISVLCYRHRALLTPKKPGENQGLIVPRSLEKEDSPHEVS